MANVSTVKNKLFSDKAFVFKLIYSLKKPSIIFLIFSCCFVFWFDDLLKNYFPDKNQNNFTWDGMGYYSYLPSTFYYHGTFEFEYGQAWYLPINGEGKRYPKYTYGVALMEAPFYGIGCLVAYMNNKPLDGFSVPFADSVRFGNIMYVFLGLIFLRKFLLKFFNDTVTAITLFCCLFGSLLYMYTFIQSEISHGYLFALFSVFLFYTYQWHQNQKVFYIIVLAFVLAVISITRFTDIYIALIFVFWDVKKLSGIKAKFHFFLNNYIQLLWFPLIGVLLWIPQMLFWKHFLGEYFTNPYLGEEFFWKDPQILNILFSYRKGWITYTPIVLMGFAGLFFIKSEFPVSKFVFAVILIVTVYVFSCWWDWNYGGCFGSRPFCQLIAILSIPMAFLVNKILFEFRSIFLKNILSVLLFVFIFSCTFLNIGQSYQYQVQGLLHTHEMSKYVYWKLFRTFHYDQEFLKTYSSRLHPRDQDSWKKGLERDDVK